MTKQIATIAILAKMFPACFAVFEQRRRPLKIGIHLDILAATGGAIAPDELRRALSLYVGNPGYLRALMRPGAVRVGLDGEPAGVMTHEEAEHARFRLLKLGQRRDAAKQPKCKPVDPPIKRSSLTDLRAAAQQRRMVPSVMS